jgi:hypothetical protein
MICVDFMGRTWHNDAQNALIRTFVGRTVQKEGEKETGVVQSVGMYGGIFCFEIRYGTDESYRIRSVRFGDELKHYKIVD